MLRALPVLVCIMLCFSAFSQNELPNTKIKALNGSEISFNSLAGNSDTAIIVSLWATWCIPCITELETFKDQYEERQKEAPFKIIAVSVDDSRTSSRVRSFVKGRGWDFDIYLDVNNDLKRALNISDVPHVLLIKKGKIIYQHNGYVIGDEEELFKKLKASN